MLRAVADATGEEIGTIDAMGFDLVPEPIEEEESGPYLWLDCPFCGHVVHLSDDGVVVLPEAAECGHCETLFSYAFDEIYEAPVERIAGQLLDRQMAFAA